MPRTPRDKMDVLLGVALIVIISAIMGLLTLAKMNH